MSTPYPEIKADESGLVPSQPTLRSEWPKKLRALTQQDLDRLTIDQDGRFYWDGKPVTSATTHSGSGADSAEPRALEMLDRAAMEIAGRKPEEIAARKTEAAQTPKEGAEVKPNEPTKSIKDSRSESKPVQVPKPIAAVVPMERAVPAGIARRTSIDGKVRISLSMMQSLGAFIVTLALLASAIGLAATGWAAAHEWSCRLGWVPLKVCPADLAPKGPTRTLDIPT